MILTPGLQSGQQRKQNLGTISGLARYFLFWKTFLIYKVPLYREPSGFSIPQSGAIERYLARKYGFSGSDQEQSTIDAIGEGVNDLAATWYAATRYPVEAERGVQVYLNPSQLSHTESQKGCQVHVWCVACLAWTFWKITCWKKLFCWKQTFFGWS